MIKFPFTSFQQFNLDWIMQQLKKILDFMPLNGVPGDVLQRNVDGAAWMPISAVSMDIHGLTTIPDVDPADELPIYDNDQQGNYKVSVSDLMDTAPVQSVNGQTGDVVLSIPLVPVDSVNGQTGTVVLDASDVGALPDTYVAPVTSVNGQTGDVTLVIPSVFSVNNQVGAVVLDASDVGALPDTYVAPVTSVNGQTGDVVVGGGSSSPTLLWTNSAPLVSFAEQTVTLDLSEYSFVIVECSLTPAGLAEVITSLFPVPTITPPVGYSAYNTMFGVYLDGSYVRIGRRHLTIATSGISFGWGSRVEALNGSAATDDRMCRPTRIWGIK